MSSAQFEYKNNIFTPGTLSERIHDTLFGTSLVDNKNQNALLNYQNQFNEYMMDKANEFNKEMSSTAYQRAMEDMTKAGINPLIAFNQGAKPASSPQSATAQSASATAPKYDRQGGIIGKATARMVNEFADNLSGKNLREMLPELIKAVF